MNILLIYSFFSFFYIILRVKCNLLILQQNFYNENNRYLKWGKVNYQKVFSFGCLFIFLCNFCNVFFQKDIFLIVNIFYLFFFLFSYFSNKKEQVKIPLKVTSRLKRLCVTITILFFIPFLTFCFFPNIYLFFCFLSFLIFINFFLVFLANFVNKPIEKCVFLHYKNMAVKKLHQMNHLKVIGITGSYGKTSSKNILNDILSVRFNSFPTPHNYNTQYGLILTINNFLDKYEDIFIAEMGAFKKGRIRLLCDLVKPQYGIITTIGTAHLETFGSRENIQEGKFELIESLPRNGLGILNMDDPYQVSYKIRNNCPIIWIAIHNEDADFVARNILINSSGMSFDVFFKETKETVHFTTKLLGEANIYNILAGIAFGKYLGMTYQELILGVKKIKPIEHRLQLINRGNDTIIDDAYNSNPVGSKMALDVLDLMDGMKIVVTPGMIELGEEQYQYNKKFGEYISEVADYVILVGEQQTKPILDGLIEKNYNCDKIKVINDVKDALKIIDDVKDSNKHTYILLENDLPDIYNEK